MCNLIILVIVFCNGLLWLFLSNGCLSLGWCETDVQRRCDPPSTGWTIREEARNIGELFFCLSMESEDLLFTKLYVLQHMFREPEKRPLTAVSNFFTVLVALPFLVLLVLVSLLLLKYSARQSVIFLVVVNTLLPWNRVPYKILYLPPIGQRSIV